MSSWAKGFQSMSNALCCDPVLAPRLEQPPAGSREVDTTAHLPLCILCAAAWSWLTADCGQNRERWLEHSAWTNYYQLSPLGLKIPLGKNDVREKDVSEKLQNTSRGELLLLAAAPGTQLLRGCHQRFQDLFHPYPRARGRVVWCCSSELKARVFWLRWKKANSNETSRGVSEHGWPVLFSEPFRLLTNSCCTPQQITGK